MGVSLSKGENLSLSAGHPKLSKILVGLGWDARTSSGAAFDLDASAFLLNDQGLVNSDNDFIFYNQTVSSCKSVKHTGDNRTGEGEGDDESLVIDLTLVPQNVKKVSVVVTIHDGERLNQNFGQVSSAFMRIVDTESGVEIARFDLSEDFSSETALIFGDVYLHKGEWKFKAVGEGYRGGLIYLCKRFGVTVG